MRPWSKPLLAAALLLAAPAARAKTPGASYDPEIALLIQNVQAESVEHVREELLRQAEWLELGAMKVLFSEKLDLFARNVAKNLNADSDVVEDFRAEILKVDPTGIGEVDRLVSEIRRYHDLQPGKPMVRLPWPPPPGPVLNFLTEEGIGADADSSLKGTPAMDEPVAYAERRFGATGPFLRRRKWNLDFYLGSFSDLLQHYKKLGYRRIYRLRAPYISYAKEAWVMSPEPGLRPRLVYCGFYGQDLFLHTRAQWAILTALAKGEGPIVNTLTCPECRWVLPGVRAMKSLLSTIPYAADTVIAGYGGLFEPQWKDAELGTYENEYWRLAYYRTGPTITATVTPRRTNFGEVLAASLTQLVRRGARRVYVAGPVAVVGANPEGRNLSYPTEFVTFTGKPVSLDNALAGRKNQPALFAALPSPLLATREWLKDSARHGVMAFDGEISRVAEESAAWNRTPGVKVEIGIAGLLGELSHLHPEEDHTISTVDDDVEKAKEKAKRRYRDAVLERIKEAAKNAEE